MLVSRKLPKTENGAETGSETVLDRNAHIEPAVNQDSAGEPIR